MRGDIVKVLYTIIIIALLFVSGCSLGDDEKKYELVYVKDEVSLEIKNEQNHQKITVAIVPKVVNILYFNAIETGALEAANDLNVNVIYHGPAEANSDAQIEIVNEMIQANVDVIAVSANDPEELAPVLKKAKNSGIKVITWDSDTLPESRDLFINMVDPEVLGRHLMDLLAWNTDESGEYAVMMGSFTAANSNEWTEWIKIHQEEYYPDMKLVEIVANDEDPIKSYNEAIKLLKKYPMLKGIIGSTSEAPPAIATAVKELNVIDEVAVVGLSSPSLMRDHLKDGSAKAITLWSPKKLGYLTVSLAKNIVEDSPPYDGQDIPKVGKVRVKEETVIMGEPIDFTKENVDQYDF
ncbi:ABC transporter substrate-binding protein [Alkalihalobacillus trypoxylicola]|uniref:ABC transporter substrate-binding protein n=1 Tax=Alkalihalobacillus trypoxylicola TaxID=519424 RepID=A0A161QBH3_9BACI|nr:ABC transporter substrate-binding protein [Alkalihalobacillus trypoxylicola]